MHNVHNDSKEEISKEITKSSDLNLFVAEHILTCGRVTSGIKRDSDKARQKIEPEEADWSSRVSGAVHWPH